MLSDEPESHFAELPGITVQLPIFNEQFVVDRLIQACCNLDYPADKLEIQVLDDSTDDTAEVAQAAVELYQSLGHRIVYIHRVNRHGFKAGALDEGLRVATGEFIAIFDADFVPPRNGSCKSCITLPIRESAWCRPAGRISTAITAF